MKRGAAQLSGTPFLRGRRYFELMMFSRHRTVFCGAALCTAALGAVLLLSGCTFGGANGWGSKHPSPTASSSIDEFYGQKLNWASCESAGFDCATAVAPIDWAQPSSGVVKLSVIRHKATGPKQGSLLVNPGGPGGSGYDFVSGSVGSAIDATLTKSFDVVGWDPRGIGRSEPIRCLNDSAMDAYLYAPPVAVEGSDAWLAEQVPKAQMLAAACAANTGELLGHIDAASNARDMDLLRAVLGDKKLNYLGFSYGTFFGAQYAKLFPAKVGRLVLDGPIDPAVSEPQDFTTQMAGFESAYRAYLTDCLQNSGCPFTGTLDQALAQSKTLFDGVAARELRTPDGRQLTAGLMGTAVSYPLYSKSSWPQLTSMLESTIKGLAGPAIGFADAYNGRDSAGKYSSDSDVYIAALCLDGAYPTDLAGTRTTMDAIAAAAPTVGAIISYTDWVQVSTACQNWPYKSVLSAAPIAAKGAAPIMIVGTTNDPATPYADAVALSTELESGVLVTRKGEGHTAYGSGNTCIDRTVDAYLVSGTVPARDPLC
jgi:pimeloyl-ACP methyl ester carboxylesterase